MTCSRLFHDLWAMFMIYSISNIFQFFKIPKLSCLIFHFSLTDFSQMMAWGYIEYVKVRRKQFFFNRHGFCSAAICQIGPRLTKIGPKTDHFSMQSGPNPDLNVLQIQTNSIESENSWLFELCGYGWLWKMKLTLTQLSNGAKIIIKICSLYSDLIVSYLLLSRNLHIFCNTLTIPFRPLQPHLDPQHPI